jgi:Na+/serine symporter
LFHEDPSAHEPWTKTIFVVVAFVVVAAVPCCVASGSIRVSLLLYGLAKPEYGIKVKLATSVIVRNSKITKLNF